MVGVPGQGSDTTRVPVRPQKKCVELHDDNYSKPYSILLKETYYDKSAMRLPSSITCGWKDTDRRRAGEGKLEVRKHNIIHSEVCIGMRPKMHTYFHI